ncbi:HalOD1 output domain-containing protein [Haloarcula sp. JP-L23]|uniref:HalOD1 output domain-containing protein n=1 Tax=Haloarcula sp. JP-L23 TaxID=2716717 RepID=UPI001D03F9B7
MRYVREQDASPSVAVIQAVSSCEDVHESELPPLHETIDTDALDALFTNWPNQSPQLDGHVRFQYCEYTVHVHSDGYLILETE